MIDHKEIERVAWATLDKYHVSEPVVDTLKIAKGEGFIVEEIRMPEHLSNVAGFTDETKKTIFLNKEDLAVRKQFTLAHELGHYFLQHKNYEVLYRIPHPEAQYAETESQANSFAAKLLMPEYMIREYLRKYNLSTKDYETMAKLFGVPIIAMKHTLEHLPKEKEE